MGIEKKAALICVVILAILFGIGLSNREDRVLPQEDPSKQSRAVAQGILEDLNNGKSAEADKKKRTQQKPRKQKNKTEPDPDTVSGESPEFRYVKVQFRDNFSKIAARELGSPHRYPILVKANPELKPRNLREGQKVRIPLTDDYEAPAASREELPARESRTYRVGQNETLSHIAREHYGKASQWRKIFAANRNQLRRPESLQAGMVIKIP